MYIYILLYIYVRIYNLIYNIYIYIIYTCLDRAADMSHRDFKTQDLSCQSLGCGPTPVPSLDHFPLISPSSVTPDRSENP